MGPIGLLAEELAKNECVLNEDLDITQENECPLIITRTPRQDLKRQVGNMAKRKRLKDVTQRRTYLGEVDEFDNEVFSVATTKETKKKTTSPNT